MQQEKITFDDFALYLLVFSVTFENWNPFGLQGVFSITKMTTIFYLISSLRVFSERISLTFSTVSKPPLITKLRCGNSYFSWNTHEYLRGGTVLFYFGLRPDRKALRA
jgi:hypothetical protein